MSYGRRGVLGLALVVLLTTACSSAVNSTTGPVPAGPLDQVSGQLDVRADSSLREVLELLADQVERRHPELSVRLRFTSSDEISATGAEVVISADNTRLDELQRAGAVGQATMFAQEVLALAVAPRNPGNVATVRDLRRPQVSVAVCENGPCGSAAQALLGRAEIDPPSAVSVDDADAALRRLTSGSVDAGFVWESDLRGQSGREARQRGVQQVALSADRQEDIRLAGLGSKNVLVAVAPSGNRTAAEAFVAQLRSPEGQQTLRSDGYR